jgi:hypothetical protein
VTRSAIRHGDRAALAYAFMTFVSKPDVTIENGSSIASGRFSFDGYLLFTPVSKDSHQRCAARVLTTNSWKS